MATLFLAPRMRSAYLQKCLAFCFIFIFVLSSAAQENAHSTHHTYAVIGAFSNERNADKLVELVKKHDFNAVVRNNQKRRLYYVYIFESLNRDEIISKVKNLRINYPEFYDSWAYTGNFTEGFEKKPVKPKVTSEVNSNTSKTPENKSVKRDTLTDNTATLSSGKIHKEDLGETMKDSPAKPSMEIKDDHYYFYFNTLNAKNLKEVKGKVNIIDAERAKQLKTAKSHELVELNDPNNGTSKVKVATAIFGFREIQHALDLDDPEALANNPAVEVSGDSIIVDFDLQRYNKGDVLVMYNVYYFKDAAIMKPESIYELNSLLDMLKENENLVVRIHGHTNGNSYGKILHLDLENKNFFSLNAVHDETRGSAKKLSLFRAYTIQHWLIDQGIKEERMDIKGWGGKKMIYDKHDSQADKNVRVEIEIVDE